MSTEQDMMDAATDEYLKALEDNGDAVDPEDFFPGGDVGELVEGGKFTLNHDRRSAHLRPIWNLRSGKVSRIPVYMMGKKVQQRDKDDRKVFTAKKADAPEYIEGTIKCFLHKDAEEADRVRALGIISTCEKSNIRTRLDRRLHHERVHEQEWKTYQEEEQRERDEEQRAFQREQMETMRAQRQQMEAQQPRRPGRPRKEVTDEQASPAV